MALQLSAGKRGEGNEEQQKANGLKKREDVGNTRVMNGKWEVGEKRTEIKSIAWFFKRIMCDIKLMCELFRPKHVGSYFCSKKISGESTLVSAYNASLKKSANSAFRVIGILTKIISALQ